MQNDNHLGPRMDYCKFLILAVKITISIENLLHTGRLAQERQSDIYLVGFCLVDNTSHSDFRIHLSDFWVHAIGYEATEIILL